MDTVLQAMVALIPTVIMLAIRAAWKQSERANFVRTYRFPAGLLAKLCEHRPDLRSNDQQLVARGLRQFYLAYLYGKRKPVSMPAKIADDLWHEFILHTRHCEEFCRKASGRFLHHTPATVLGHDRRNNEGLRRV